jgi:hypothetical protein
VAHEESLLFVDNTDSNNHSGAWINCREMRTISILSQQTYFKGGAGPKQALHTARWHGAANDSGQTHDWVGHKHL